MKKQLYITIALLAGVLIMINLLSTQFHVRLDLTEGKQYTLSKATGVILKELTIPVTVKAYFSEDLPPDNLKTRNDFRDLLTEYASRSGNMIHYEFIDPSKDERYEREAMEKGIQPIIVGMRDKDRVKQQKAYMGAEISLGDKKNVFPVIRSGADMEYWLSTAIKKLSPSSKPPIGFVRGHQEAEWDEMMYLMQHLTISYTPEPVFMTDSTSIPGYIKTLVIVSPMDTITEVQQAKLDSFLAAGGNIILALNKMGRSRMLQGINPIRTKFDEWLKKKGILLSDKVVIDAQCSVIAMQPTEYSSGKVQNPYLPVASNFAKHPITTGLEAINLDFPCSISYQGKDPDLHFIPLIQSSGLSDTVEAPANFELNPQWTQNNFKHGNLTMAALVEGNFGGKGNHGRLIIIGDGDLFISSSPQVGGRVTELYADNLSFATNAIDWMSDNTGLVELRTKGADSRPIMKLQDSAKLFLKYLNLLLPLLLAIVYGIIRFGKNRSIRIKRMQEDYNKID